jgi:hypothetical protein
MSAEPLAVTPAVFRLLTFRLSQDDFLRLDSRHLRFGLLATWLAGIGRYWDHPDAHPLQYAGLGSLFYVLLLSAFLWALVAPLKPDNWRIDRVLTFVSLTSPPALLYAIPVERFMTLEAAQTTNFWFLAIVALWRVALLFFFFRRVAQLGPGLTFVAALLPLALIVLALAALNLEHAVFEIMAGKRDTPATPHDLAYNVVVMLAILSWLAGPVLLLTYLFAVIGRRSKK